MTVTDVGVTVVGATVTGPLNVTAVAPAKLVPLITTDALTPAGIGAAEMMRGTESTVMP